MNNKGELSLTYILVGLILVSMFAGVFGVYITRNAEALDTNISGVSLDTYNQMESLETRASDIEDSITDYEQDQNDADVLGTMFSNAYNMLISIPQSIKLMFGMVNDGFQDIGIISDDGQSSSGGSIIKNAIIAIIIVLVFMGILMGILLKKVPP